MIHASVELVEAMRGEIPGTSRQHPTLRHEIRACTGRMTTERTVWGDTTNDQEDKWGPVSCPKCLRLMREAVDPVRWDALEERGLVSLPGRLDEHPRETGLG